jgi:Tol biopolymer transport system component
MALEPGRNLGHYRIVSTLGGGGMGEVYRATDTALGREVALKVLPERVAESPELRARFEREAQAVASLSHPNILAIHDLGTEDGTTFAVMELLEGETLREVLARGPLSPRRAVGYGLQLAQALAAAHDRGVVHRDVKPENVFLTREGHVKVLDFGLARQASSLLTSGGEDSVSPTLAPGTEPGTVLGTVGYMSPEQVRGEEADPRSDIFSFGAVFYEMLTGQRAFRGQTAAETMTAILRADPPEASAIYERIPPALDRVVDHCLEKDPRRRFQAAHDLAFALETAATTSTRSAAGAPFSPPRRRWPVLAAAAAGCAALALAVQAGRLVERHAARADHEGGGNGAYARLTNRPGPETWPRLSPDGKTLAFAAREAGRENEDVFIQRVGGGNAINLTPDSPGSDLQPAFSPDGEKIAFRSDRGGGGIFVMGSTGESVKRLTDFGYNPSWAPDGHEIVVSTVAWSDVLGRAGQGELWAVDVSSGERRRVETPADAVQPSWSPGGHRIAYWSVSADGQRDVWTVPARPGARGEAVAVTSDPAVDWNPVWASDGRHLYFASDRGGTMNLWQVAVEEESGAVLGPPEPRTVPARWAGHVSVSADGRQLAYVSNEVRTTLMIARLDPRGGTAASVPIPVFRGSLQIRDLAVSPDGGWVAFTTAGVREDLFVVRADGTRFRQLTDDAARDRGPAWSPDGQRVAFYSNREGDYQAWTIRPDGSDLQRVSAIPEGVWYPIFAPDGSQITTCADRGGWRVDLEQAVEAGAAHRLPRIDEEHTFCPNSWSADGRSLAGVAQGPDGEWKGIYVLSLASGRYERIDEDGSETQWFGSSRLIIQAPGRRIRVTDRGSGSPRDLFSGEAPSVSPDGRWLTYLEVSEEADVWMATLLAGRDPD